MILIIPPVESSTNVLLNHEPLKVEPFNTHVVMWLCLADDPQGIAPAGRFQVPHHRRGPRHPWLDENSAEAFCCEIQKKTAALVSFLPPQLANYWFSQDFGLQANRCRNRLFMDFSSSCNRHVSFCRSMNIQPLWSHFQLGPQVTRTF